MSKKIRTEAVDSLFEAILSLQDKEECYAFFEDVCTVNELLSLSQRFEVAKMLREKRTYLEIAAKTGRQVKVKMILQADEHVVNTRLSKVQVEEALENLVHADIEIEDD